MVPTLTPYRRHLQRCPHRAKGQHYSLCACPVWVYGNLPDGRPVRQTLRTNDWQRAAHRIEILTRAGELDVLPDSPRATLDSAIVGYLASCRKRNLEASTVASYSRTLGVLSTALGRRTVNSIDIPTLETFFASRDVKPRTYRNELERIRALFAFCIGRKWCAENPAKGIKPPKVTDLATLPFTAEEIANLLAACDLMASDDPAETPYARKRARALVMMFLYSGLRISDVTRLRRSALDRETRHLTLRIMKNKTPLKVRIHEDVIAALDAVPVISPEYFFWTGNGDPATCTKNLRRTIYRIGKLAKVSARPHRFRDTFAVELLTNGKDIRTVQLLLGHESVRTTERHYAHFVAAHQALLDDATDTLNFEPKAGRPLLLKPLKNRRRNA